MHKCIEIEIGMEIEKGEDSSTDPTVASLLIGKSFMGFYIWATIVKLRVESHLLFPDPKCFGKGPYIVHIYLVDPARSLKSTSSQIDIHKYNIPVQCGWIRCLLTCKERIIGDSTKQNS